MHETLKPYLINAFYSWCMDIGYTPLITVAKWNANILPENLSQENEIIFNIHPDAVRNLIFSKDTIKFEAILNKQAFQILLHHQSIINIHTNEDDYGLSFDLINEPPEEKIYKKPHLVLVKNTNEDKNSS